jgi:hypothetical protein
VIKICSAALDYYGNLSSSNLSDFLVGAEGNMFHEHPLNSFPKQFDR